MTKSSIHLNKISSLSKANIREMMVHLLVKIHEQNNFVLNRREEVVFVNKLVDIFVSQPQVDLQSSVIALVIRVSRERN